MTKSNYFWRIKVGFFQSLMKSAFGVNERDIKDLWRKYENMESKQLQYIYNAQFLKLGSQLALIVLFKRSQKLCQDTIHEHTPKESGYSLDEVYKSLERLAKKEYIAMGQGKEFDEIRFFLKKFNDNQNFDDLGF